MSARGLTAGLLSLSLFATSHACTAAVATVGWIENVKLGEEGVVVAAKLDTGALTSSLHATEVRWTSKADGDWVTFDVIGADGVRARFERKVVRISRVKRASGGSQSRPVVLMDVCLGHVRLLTEVNLTDRSGFNYEFLIGRRYLSRQFAVDSSRTHTIDPACAESGKQ